MSKGLNECMSEVKGWGFFYQSVVLGFYNHYKHPTELKFLVLKMVKNIAKIG